MQRFVVSTIGTSTLTNSINRGDPAEGTWFGILRDSANKTQDEITDNELNVIDELASRALTKLNKGDVGTNRRASAELNGIYGIYQGSLPTRSEDRHCLICTDTAQGQITGTLIKDFLESCGFNVDIVIPSKLSTKNTTNFTAGTKELIKWLENNVSWQQDSVDHEVVFNLVGGFKSLQGYMQTFGTFYANVSVYIFEGSSELIRIPRLPIKIDTSAIEEHILEFAMMTAGELYPETTLEGVPETLLEPVEENGNIAYELSEWGDLIWSRTKSVLLSGNLLQFPRLVYRQSFIDDYEGLNAQQRTDLQETLAKIATVLEDTGGDTTQLNQRVSGLKFQELKRFDNIYTFRIARGIRVSCSITDDGLYLYKYGPRNTINRNPN